MKRAILLVLMAVSGVSGCCCPHKAVHYGGGGCAGGCSSCGRNGAASEQYTDSGPGMAGVTYPYYTTRGPRDFLAKNPPSIGP
ncbi:MAG: hypothetical protein K8T25_20745 [Planctomycetia bacterium]|nr:hypothetical protein [Planctomycetia bacterium]